MGCATSVVSRPADKHIIENYPKIHPITDTMPMHHKRIIKRTWRYLANDMTGYGSKVFLRIFTLNPHVKQLFPCRNAEGEALLKDENFKGHASRFMQAVGAAVDHIDDWDASLSPLLLGLGKQHVAFTGFKPEYFEAFTEAMMFVWQTTLKDKFDMDTREAWKSVFDFIMSTLREGYDIAEKNKPNDIYDYDT